MAARAEYLVLSVILAFLGAAVAWNDGFFHPWRALLAGSGLVLAHASVNLLNNYFDFRSGIDLMTDRTPFSGGSPALPEGLLSPRQVLAFGFVTFSLAALIGIYFTVVVGWLLLPILAAGGFFIILYSPLILRLPWPEWAAGAGLGALPVLGMYFVIAGRYSLTAAAASIPPALLVHNLLLLNEFIDVKADRTGGRRTLPVTIGCRMAAVFYSIVALAVYIWIIIWVAAGIMPAPTLLALLTLPLAFKSISGARHSNEKRRLVPAMANNVIMVLLTQLLIGIGFVAGGIW